MAFDVISGQPNDTDIVRLTEAIAQIMFLVPYDEVNTSHSLIGLIYSKADYMEDNIDEFPRPTKPGIYDMTIAANAKDAVRAMKEAVHKAVCRDYALFEAA